MAKLRDETINKIIHEKILGLCWHKRGSEHWIEKYPDNPNITIGRCLKCKAFAPERLPNYVNSLDDVSKVEKKCIEEKGKYLYGYTLTDYTKDRFTGVGVFGKYAIIASLDARTRCMAILTCYKMI